MAKFTRIAAVEVRGIRALSIPESGADRFLNEVEEVSGAPP